MAIRHQYADTAGIIGAYGAGQAERRRAERDYARTVLLQQQRHAQRMQELGYASSLRGGRRGARGTGTIGGRWIDPLATGGGGGETVPQGIPGYTGIIPSVPEDIGTRGVSDAYYSKPRPIGSTPPAGIPGYTGIIPAIEGAPAEDTRDRGTTLTSYYSTPRPLIPGAGVPGFTGILPTRPPEAAPRSTGPMSGLHGLAGTPHDFGGPALPEEEWWRSSPPGVGTSARGAVDAETALYMPGGATKRMRPDGSTYIVPSGGPASTPPLAPGTPGYSGTGIPRGGYASPAMGREQELEQRRLRVQQNAQMRQYERTGVRGNLLPYYEPPVSMEQQRFDLQRQRFGLEQQRFQQGIQESRLGREASAKERMLARKMDVYGERTEKLLGDLDEIAELGGGGQYFTPEYKAKWDKAQQAIQAIYRGNEIDTEDPVEVYEAIANSPEIQEALEFDPRTNMVPFEDRPGATVTRDGISYKNSLDGTGRQEAIGVEDAEEFIRKSGYKGPAWVDISSGRPKVVPIEDDASAADEIMKIYMEKRKETDEAGDPIYKDDQAWEEARKEYALLQQRREQLKPPAEGESIFGTPLPPETPAQPQQPAEAAAPQQAPPAPSPVQAERQPLATALAEPVSESVASGRQQWAEDRLLELKKRYPNVKSADELPPEARALFNNAMMIREVSGRSR